MSISHLSSALKLSQAKEVFESFIQSAPIAMLIVDNQGVIVLSNYQSENLLGYKKEEMTGMKIESLMPQRFRTAHSQHRKTFTAGTEDRLMGPGKLLFALRKDDREIPVEIGLSHLEKFDTRYIICSIVDISIKRETEELIRQQSMELQEKNRRLIQTNRELAQANEAKSRFLSCMTHELRTPLNAVIGYTELLEEGLRRLQESDCFSDLTKIKAASLHLSELIDNILDIQKIEKDRLQIVCQKVVFEDFLENLVSIAEPLVRKNGNIFQVHNHVGNRECVIDALRLRQILLNLLSNAGKFTRNGTVTLEISEAAHDGRPYLEFSVRDTGIGMSEDEQKEVFKAFTQADSSSTRKFGGTGLGLTISKELALLMGGHLTLQSQKGVGSVFLCSLPITSDS